MTRQDITINNHINIRNNETILLTGNNEKLTIEVQQNVYSEIILFDTKIDYLYGIIHNNGKLKLKIILLKDNKNDIKFDINNNSKLNLQIVSSESYLCQGEIYLQGENASFEGKNLLISKDKQNDLNMKVYHLSPKTTSNVYNYGIGFQNSKINIDTTSKIEKGMKRATCKQLSKGVIIGEKAAIKIKPILLIDEHDVEAKHGATIGKISEDELFYLMSRGLSYHSALKLVVEGIVNPFVENIFDKKIKKEVENSIYNTYAI